MDTTILTEAEAKSIRMGLNRTLDTVIGDLLESMGKRSVKQDLVIEVCLDADYLEMYGGRKPEEKDAVKKFRTLPYAEQIKFAKTVFTYKTYGL